MDDIRESPDISAHLHGGFAIRPLGSELLGTRTMRRRSDVRVGATSDAADTTELEAHFRSIKHSDRLPETPLES